MFDSGFVQYNAHTSNFLGTRNKITNEKIQSKLPDKSINTSSIAIYMHLILKLIILKLMIVNWYLCRRYLQIKLKASKEAEDKIINALRK